MSQNKTYTNPKSLELENFIFNPIAIINVCPTVYLIYRQEHEIKDAMNKFANVQKEEKLVPKDFKLHSKDGKIFDQKSEEKSTIVTKVTTYQLKILSSMDELVQLLRKPPSITDHINYFKQRKLFADFIVRFSRNYIYEIDRIIEEIQFYQVDHYSYFERSTNHLISKVCNLFAIIMRALQVYQKQLAKMNSENSEKLVHFIESIICGINVCIELKIFDENDMLIKLLLEKSDEVISFLRDIMFDETQKQTAKKSISATSSKDIFIPTTNNRYVMYASTSKKVTPSKSTMAFSKTKGNGKCASNPNPNVNHHHHHHHQRSQQTGKIQTMFESQICLGCSGKSSACDAYEEAIKQNSMQFNDQDIDFNCFLTKIQTENIAASESVSEYSSDK